LLIKFKKERSHQEDRRLALWLATSAGLLNAIAGHRQAHGELAGIV